jgi:hypothetical protein
MLSEPLHGPLYAHSCSMKTLPVVAVSGEIIPVFVAHAGYVVVELPLVNRHRLRPCLAVSILFVPRRMQWQIVMPPR